MTSDASAADLALAAFLGSPSEAEANLALGELLVGFASPLVWKIFRRQLSGRAAGFDAADLEDLHAATLYKLHGHLLSVRAGERDAPASLPDYVAVSAFNAAAGFLMAREPERTRLRDRVRYVLRREPRFASWPGADRELVCGLARRRGEPAAAADGPALAELVARALDEYGAGWGRFPRLVGAVLERHGVPCRFEELVDALADRLGVEDAPALSLSGGETAGSEAGVPPTIDPIDPAPSAERGLEVRAQLARVWEEIAALPAPQRFALLANLRGEGGEDLLDVLVSSRVVEVGTLAASLGLGADEWRELAPRLPEDDLWIAARLGLTRQQVINLRKSARLRLARRLRGAVAGLG